MCQVSKIEIIVPFNQVYYTYVQSLIRFNQVISEVVACLSTYMCTGVFQLSHMQLWFPFANLLSSLGISHQVVTSGDDATHEL